MDYKLKLKESVELLKTKDLIAKLNIMAAKLENPYLITYLVEPIDVIKSNEIENIHSTIDEAYNDTFFQETLLNYKSPYVRYRETLKNAHKNLKINEIFRSKDLVNINEGIRGIHEGYRKKPISLVDHKNNLIHKGVDANQIAHWIDQLINDINKKNDLDFIIRSLLIHHKFEQVHPFNDGNGRTGRILFAVLLTKYKVFEVPATFFSYSIAKNKGKYYTALKMADQQRYNDYIFEMLLIFNDSLNIAINFFQQLIKDMNSIFSLIEKKDKNLLKVANATFYGMKVSINFLIKKTKLNEKTIKKKLKQLIDLGVIKKEKVGKYTPYKNLIIEKLIKNHFSEVN